MINYDKDVIKEALDLEDIFELLAEWGADPEYTSFGILSATICHNEPGDGSKKLYFYTNSGLFQCYTNCGSFDIFELTMKVFSIQYNVEMDLNMAVRWIALKFGIAGEEILDDFSKLKDWEYLSKYDKLANIELPVNEKKELKEFSKDILKCFNYQLLIGPWLKENISQEAIEQANIGYYLGGDQITIPHFDENGRLVGIRGRTMCQEEGERFGKYRPLKINKVLYNHPLGFNLYNLNYSSDNIKTMKKAIIFESEKSCLLYKSYFGIENDISVACCGSNISAYQINLLKKLGVDEIIIAFDREGEKDDKKKYVSKFYRLNNKFKNEVNISFIYDKDGKYLDYKDSPIDKGKEVFLKLFKERIIIKS